MKSLVQEHFLSRARLKVLRDFGASLSPQNAFYIMLGLETLGPRIMKHVSNAEYLHLFYQEKKKLVGSNTQV